MARVRWQWMYRANKKKKKKKHGALRMMHRHARPRTAAAVTRYRYLLYGLILCGRHRYQVSWRGVTSYQIAPRRVCCGCVRAAHALLFARLPHHAVFARDKSAEISTYGGMWKNVFGNR